MNFLRKNNISFNNFEQLNILNDLYNIPKILDNKKRLASNSKKKDKTIFLEKRSPNHFPQYIKLVKKSINDFPKSKEKNKNSITNRGINKYSFSNITQNRNSLYTDISQNLNRLNKNQTSFITFNKGIDKTNNNEFENSFVYSQEEENNKKEIVTEIKTQNFKRLLEKHSRKKSLFIFEEEDNKEKEIVTEIKTQNFKRKDKKTKTLKLSSDDIKLFNFGESSKKKISSQNFQPQELKVIQEYSPKRSMNIFNFKANEIQFSSGIRKENDKRDRRKRTTVRMEGAFTNKLLFNQKKKQPTNIFFYEMEKK